jgi:dephospho-CoA kinase
MSKPKIIALTGSIGSGKSTVARLFEGWGATIVDADEIARTVVSRGTPGLAEVATTFGNQILLANGELNRKALGDLIFADPKERAKLEAITHPLIRKMTNELIDAALQTRTSLILHVVPLLFESKLDLTRYFSIVVVAARAETLERRVMARDNCSLVSAQARLAAQLPTEEKEARANYIIRNDGDLDQLERSSRQIFDLLAAS